MTCLFTIFLIQCALYLFLQSRYRYHHWCTTCAHLEFTGDTMRDNSISKIYLSLFSYIPDENLCFWTSVKIHAFKFYKFIKLAASNKYPLYRIHIFVSNLLFLIADKSCIGHSASIFQKVYTVSSNNYLTRHKTWFFYGKYWYLDRCIKIKL